MAKHKEWDVLVSVNYLGVKIILKQIKRDFFLAFEMKKYRAKVFLIAFDPLNLGGDRGGGSCAQLLLVQHLWGNGEKTESKQHQKLSAQQRGASDTSWVKNP